MRWDRERRFGARMEGNLIESAWESRFWARLTKDFMISEVGGLPLPRSIKKVSGRNAVGYFYGFCAD